MGELGQGVARVGTISWDQRGGRVATKSGDKTVRTGELGLENWGQRIGTGEFGKESWDQRGGRVGTKSGDKTIRTGELGPESWESCDQEMGQDS